MLTSSFYDEELINKVIVGCNRFVENMEKQWYGPRVKHRSPSERQLVQLSVLFPSLLKSNCDFRSGPEINSRLSGIGMINPAIINRSLKTLVNVGYLEKSHIKKHSEISGPNIIYTKTAERRRFEELISRSAPRTKIYNTLLRHGILERYLRVSKYCKLLINRDVNVEQALKAKSAKGNEQPSNNESFRKDYVNNRELLKDKTNWQILQVARNLAKMDLENKSLDDYIYTVFFVSGGLSYREIVHVPYAE